MSFQRKDFAKSHSCYINLPAFNEWPIVQRQCIARFTCWLAPPRFPNLGLLKEKCQAEVAYGEHNHRQSHPGISYKKHGEPLLEAIFSQKQIPALNMSPCRPNVAIALFLTLASLSFLFTLVRQFHPEFSSIAVYHVKTDSQSGHVDDHPNLLLAERLWEQSVHDRSRMLTASFNKKPKQAIQDFIYPYNVWDLLRPTFFCPFDLERVGKLGDGGKWVCGMSHLEAQSRGPSSDANPETTVVVYSFSVERDSSFEAALLTRLNAEIWGLDYSVDGWADEVPPSSRVHFTKAAISATTDKQQSPPKLAVHDIMKDIGHQFIHVMKMDIEGAEFEALAALINGVEKAGKKVLPVGQLLLELHLISRDGIPSTVDALMKWFERLEEFGMRPAYNEHNWIGDVGSGRPQFIEVTFVLA